MFNELNSGPVALVAIESSLLRDKNCSVRPNAHKLVPFMDVGPKTNELGVHSHMFPAVLFKLK